MFKKIVGLGFSSKGKNAKDVETYISSLVESGATEFFTGYNPSYWSDKFGFEVSPNGRFSEHEQITDLATLISITLEVHKHDFEIFINLNSWYYTSETMPLIKKMIEEFKQINIDGIICGNISILEYLKEIGYTGKINISTIMAVYNTEAIQFLLENYEINKVILSREITLREIENIVTSFPNTLFEVFGEGDFCRYNNGLCFAEHKYGVKDICTVVVNDLIIKKKYNPEFKKIILDTEITGIDKINFLNDEYNSPFNDISIILGKIELGLLDKNKLEDELYNIINLLKNRIDLYFDSLQVINSQKNINFIILLRALKYLKKEEFYSLEKELENSFKTGLEYLTKKTKEIGGNPKLKAFELANFYSRGDNLNLYSYLFFSKFKNIETVKFPTRGRNYNEKLKIIEEVVTSGKIDTEKYLNRSISLERTHYDLTYLFLDKLWFRNIINKF